MDNKDDFRVRCYRKGELALLYTPGVGRGSAVRTLQRWIRRNSQLTASLTLLGYQPTDKIFSAAQVSQIVKYLGCP